MSDYDLIDWRDLQTRIKSVDAQESQKEELLRHLSVKVFYRSDFAYAGDVWHAVADIAASLKSKDCPGFLNILRLLKDQPVL